MPVVALGPVNAEA